MFILCSKGERLTREGGEYEVVSQKPREEMLDNHGQQFWRSGRVQEMLI